MKAKKFDYLKVIQQHYGCCGWEDVSHYETDSTGWAGKEIRDLIKHDVKEYRLMGYPTRVIFRRELRV